MRRTLVLAVDRDDDFGEMGKVSTPAIGVKACKEAAAALGLADPEDSDTNALYMAIKTCMDIRADGGDAEVALICGNKSVGHKSDLELVKELEAVLAKVKPEGVILVGDGAEDEYIYPIISSRAAVDSVVKVYVKQVPGIEGSFYIINRMLSDPEKRKRFVAPLGFLILVLSLFFIMPSLLLYLRDGDSNVLINMSSSLSIFFAGLILILYGYSIGRKATRLKDYLYVNVLTSSTKVIFLTISVALVLISAVWAYMEVTELYFAHELSRVIYFVSCMVWPAAMALMVYVTGLMISEYQTSKILRTSTMVTSINMVAYAMVFTGVIDIAQMYLDYGDSMTLGLAEIAAGVALSIATNYVKGKMEGRKVFRRRRKPVEEDASDAVLRMGAGVRGDPVRHGVLPRGRRVLRQDPHVRDTWERPCVRRGRRGS
ncbi:MAG: DUF373 family protein, partial [Candidatus Methanomethylophilaceae archaeon]|nr:DUF373 family protein [Candidatus Methanomethylophilaceae archaeon]